jgi:hypothetical protein
MSDRLNPGDSLVRGEKLTSNNGQVELIMQDDGNLVLYLITPPPVPSIVLWSAKTNEEGKDGLQAVMQCDGNLVVLNRHGVVVWETATPNYPNSIAVVQDDHNFVVYYPTWATGTNVKQ